jgi:hypothetical protein
MGSRVRKCVGIMEEQAMSHLFYSHHHHHYDHHDVAIKELGHLLTCPGHTHPEVCFIL